MKIKINEKESYNIDLPNDEEVDVITFKGMVQRFNDIEKMINKSNPSQYDVSNTGVPHKAGRGYGASPLHIFLNGMNEQEAKAFIDTYRNDTWNETKKLMDKYNSPRDVVQNKIFWLAKKWNYKRNKKGDNNGK